MTLLQRVKRLLGWGDSGPTEAEGSDVTVHVEHPGLEGPEEDVDELELVEIKGIGPTYATRLHDAGIADVTGLAEADPAVIADETGISETRLATWVERARAMAEGP